MGFLFFFITLAGKLCGESQCEVCITWLEYNSSLYRWRGSVCLVHIVPLPYFQTIEAHFITLALGALYSGGGAKSLGLQKWRAIAPAAF